MGTYISSMEQFRLPKLICGPYFYCCNFYFDGYDQSTFNTLRKCSVDVEGRRYMLSLL